MKQRLYFPAMKHIYASLSLICGILFLTPANGDSLVGGDISYTYIGDSTGIPNQYLVDVGIQYVLRYSGNPASMSTPDVCVQSSCFTGFTVSSVLHPAMPPHNIPIGNNECLQASDLNFLPMYRRLYQAIVTLPDTCSDITFTVNHCCRLNDSSLVNYTQSGSLFLQAKLNNTLGNRSAPLFLPSHYALSFCYQGVFLPHGLDNALGDSVVFRLKPLQTGSCAGSPPTDAVFESGYSDSLPFAVHSSSSLDIEQPGSISFKPASVNGNFAYAVEFDVYVETPGVPGNYYLLGTIHREEVFSVGSQCAIQYNPFPALGIHAYDMIPTSVLRMLPYSDFIPFTDSVPDPNSPSGYSMEWIVYEYGCYDTNSTLISSHNIICQSISTNGSEFSVYAPDTSVVPVVSSRGKCNPYGLTNEVEYEFASRLQIQGDYYVTIMKGTDSNTFINHCGFEMIEYFTFVIRNLCPTGFSTSVYIDKADVKVYPNPNNGIFTLSADGNVYRRTELYDLQGRMIYQTALEQKEEHQLEIGRLAPGQYLLRLFNAQNGMVVTEKIVVQ